MLAPASIPSSSRGFHPFPPKTENCGMFSSTSGKSPKSSIDRAFNLSSDEVKLTQYPNTGSSRLNSKVGASLKMNQLMGTRGDRMKGSGASCRSFLWLKRATFVASAVAPPDAKRESARTMATKTPRMTPSHREIRRRQSRRIVAKHTRGRQTPRARAPPLLPLLPHPSSPRAALQPLSLSLALSLAHPPWGVTAVDRKKCGMREGGPGATKNGDFGDPTGQKHGNQY